MQQKPHEDEADVDRPQEVQHGPQEGRRVPHRTRTVASHKRRRGRLPVQGRGAQQDCDRRLPGRAERLQRASAQGLRGSTRLHRSHPGPGSPVSDLSR